LPEVVIRISVPEGTTVTIAGVEGARLAAEHSQAADVDRVERYFRDFLSDNGRRVFGAAARIEDHAGPGFTLEDIASNLSVTYETVRSWHRTAGRSAKRWRKETGTPEPVRLESMDYDWDPNRQGFRTAYRLPDGVADEIVSLGP
jgi:hypothetical protein